MRNKDLKNYRSKLFIEVRENAFSESTTKQGYQIRQNKKCKLHSHAQKTAKYILSRVNNLGAKKPCPYYPQQSDTFEMKLKTKLTSW